MITEGLLCNFFKNIYSRLLVRICFAPTVVIAYRLTLLLIATSVIVHVYNHSQYGTDRKKKSTVVIAYYYNSK